MIAVVRIPAKDHALAHTPAGFKRARSAREIWAIGGKMWSAHTIKVRLLELAATGLVKRDGHLFYRADTSTSAVRSTLSEETGALAA